VQLNPNLKPQGHRPLQASQVRRERLPSSAIASAGWWPSWRPCATASPRLCPRSATG